MSPDRKHELPIDPPDFDTPVDEEEVGKAVGTPCVHCGSSATDRRIEDGSTIDTCRDCGLRTVGFVVDDSIDLDIRPRWAWRTPQDKDRMLEYDSTGLC